MVKTVGNNIDISIIIINYNTFELTCNCIKSIIKETKNINYELIIVDNKSTKDDPNLFLKEFPEVKLIISPKNLGFAGGNNLGLELAKSKYVLLLNSDTVILNDAIYKTWHYLEKSSADVGVLGCKLLNPDGSLQPSTGEKTRGGYSIKKLIYKELTNNPIYFHLDKRFKTDENKNLSQTDQQEVYETNLVVGAYMLVRKEVFEKAGLLDEDFFMYNEELEWCNRIVRAGFKILFYPFAEIIHIGKQSSSNINMSRQIYLSQALFYFKVLGYRGYFMYILINFFNLITNVLFYPFLSKNSQFGVGQYIKKFGGSLYQMLSIIVHYQKKTSSGKVPLKSSDL